MSKASLRILGLLTVEIVISSLAAFLSRNVLVQPVQAQQLRARKTDRAAPRILWVNWGSATVGSRGSALGKINAVSPINISALIS